MAQYKHMTNMIEDYLAIIYQEKEVFRPYPFDELKSLTWGELLKLQQKKGIFGQQEFLDRADSYPSEGEVTWQQSVYENNKGENKVHMTLKLRIYRTS